MTEVLFLSERLGLGFDLSPPVISPSTCAREDLGDRPQGPPRATLSFLIYVSQAPLPVGVGLPPEARLSRLTDSAVFAACQPVGSAGFVSACQVTCAFYCHQPSVKSGDRCLSDSP